VSLISPVMLTHRLHILSALTSSLCPWWTPRSPPPVLVLGHQRLPANSATHARRPGRPHSSAIPPLVVQHVTFVANSHAAFDAGRRHRYPKNPVVVVASPVWSWQRRSSVAYPELPMVATLVASCGRLTPVLVPAKIDAGCSELCR
jgi:hypothetical protein